MPGSATLWMTSPPPTSRSPTCHFPEPLEGPDAFKEMLSQTHHFFPDLTIEVDAVLAEIAHTEAHSRLQHDYVLFEVRLDPDEHLLTVGSDMLPDDWRAVPWPTSTQEIGTFWHEEQASVVLDVPSAVVPRQRNVLVNVAHPRFNELQIQEPEPFEIDSRRA